MTLINLDNHGQNVDKDMGQIEKRDKRVLSYLLKQRIRSEAQAILAQEFTPRREDGGLNVDYKADHSIVTKIDLLVSSRIKELLLPQLPSTYTFFSCFKIIIIFFPFNTKRLVFSRPNTSLKYTVFNHTVTLFLVSATLFLALK